MALLNLITFFIHAVVQAMAATLGAVFKHLLPAVFVVALLGAGVAVLCTSCGVGGVALLRRRKRNNG